MEKTRNYKFDNLKVLLIFLVVFGHMLEFCKANSIIAEPLYLIIYSFHMGVFLFVSGVFAKFSKIHIFSIFFAYLIFQPFYRIDLVRQYSISILNPQWILWYIFTFGLYTLLIPLIDQKSKVGKTLIFITSIILSLASGYGSQFGYFLSLSRFFVFLPFFVVGFYFKNHIKKVNNILENKKVRYSLLSVFGILCIGASLFIGVFSNFTDKMMYGAFAYDAIEGYSITHRLMLLFTGFIWTTFLYIAMPKKTLSLLQKSAKIPYQFIYSMA